MEVSCSLESNRSNAMTATASSDETLTSGKYEDEPLGYLEEVVSVRLKKHTVPRRGVNGNLED